MGSIPLRTDPDSYVLVTIPRSLEASARVAIAGLYQPFFVEWAEDGIVLVARAAEWERVVSRFPGAATQSGFRLISLGAASTDPEAPPLGAGDLAALVRRLTTRGIHARTLRSFYRDHLLVAERDLDACREALRSGDDPTDPSSGG